MAELDLGEAPAEAPVMPARAGIVLAVLLPALGLCGCGVSDEAAELEHLDLASEAALAIARDLDDAVRRLHEASRRSEEALAEADEARFEALDALRAATGVDGIAWEGPGAERAWSGRAVEPVSFPPPPPWRASFRTGDLTYVHGPYLRALVLGPIPVRGGMLTASVILEETSPDVETTRPFTSRWLEPLGVEHVRLVAPGAAPEDVENAISFVVQDATVAHDPNRTRGAPLLRGVVVPPGLQAVRDRLESTRRGVAGGLFLLLWAGLTYLAFRLASRRLPSSAGRWLAFGGLAILARTVLGAIDLPGRFPFLQPAFAPSDFGIDDPFGWLASPADFALTTLAFLVAAACFQRAVKAMKRPGPRALDAVALIAGIATAAATAALWVAVVELAVAQGQTEFFAEPSIVPSLPAALMLAGLVAATAAAWVVCVASLVVASSGSPKLAMLPWALFPAGGAAALALGLAHTAGGPAWAAPMLPLASLLACIPPATEERTALPSRVLLVGVLATILLFPLLWNRVAVRRGRALSETLDRLHRAEATALTGTYLDFERLANDERLKEAFLAARRGPSPEGLALDVWLQSFLAQPGARGLVSLLDPQGRLLDEFTMTPLPRDRIPRPAPPAAGAGDLQVVTARGDGTRMRCVVGRLTLWDDAGSSLGHVVFTVPDAVDLAMIGLGPARRDARTVAGGGHPLQYAILSEGKVIRSSDPSVSRREGSFGPPELSTLGPDNPEVGWETNGEEGYAVWSWDRGVALGVRRPTERLNDAVLALARLVVVGVGLAGVGALVLLVVGLRRFRPRLHHRILVSYFVISFIPLVVLGWASARDARARHDAFLSQRLEVDIRRARNDLEAFGAHLFDQASSAHLVKWAGLRGHDILLYRDGRVHSASLPGLVEAQVIPERLPADAYRATVLEGREIVRREDSFAGRPMWFGCAPVLDAVGRTVATVGVPLLYDKDRVEERFAVTGSVLVAAWLLTLVLVLVGGLWAARRLARPLGLLAAGTQRVSAGELDVELEPAGSDELGDLVRAFNTMTRDLEAAQARVVRAEREMAWRRMARQVAHEIKNPLTPIRLMIQQMEADVARDPSGAVQAIRRTAPVVLRQIEALGRIAADFAHFARMPRRTLEDVDLADLARDVVALHQGSADEGIEVTADIAEGVPPLTWDAGELRRVLVNLIGNAVQAIREAGRVEVRLRPEAVDGAEGVRLEVRDDGEGIRPEHRDRLFEPDFSTKTSGTGLGLAMVKRTLDDMGGTIAVESVPGEGSTFALWFPRHPESPAPER